MGRTCYHCFLPTTALIPFPQYLRRSGTAGYLVPLSGGIDSCATATIVFGMCRMVIDAIKAGNSQVIEDVKRLAAYGQGKLPETPQELCNQIFHTIYMGMSKQSSAETRGRAKELAEAIGSYHVNLDIDEVFEAQRNLLVKSLNFEPKFKVHGGSIAENITLQNIQARSRMVTGKSSNPCISHLQCELIQSASLLIRSTSAYHSRTPWRRRSIGSGIGQCWGM